MRKYRLDYDGKGNITVYKRDYGHMVINLLYKAGLLWNIISLLSGVISGMITLGGMIAGVILLIILGQCLRLIVSFIYFTVKHTNPYDRFHMGYLENGAYWWSSWKFQSNFSSEDLAVGWIVQDREKDKALKEAYQGKRSLYL